MGRPVLGLHHRRRHGGRALRGRGAHRVRLAHELGQRDDDLPLGDGLPARPAATPCCYRRHVRIDVIYEALSPRTRARLDAFTFVFFVGYMLTLIWVGDAEAWNSFQIGETTSTPWNPVIWPVKAAIPAAGLLLLLQGVANLIRDMGWAPGGTAR